MNIAHAALDIYQLIIADPRLIDLRPRPYRRLPMPAKGSQYNFSSDPFFKQFCAVVAEMLVPPASTEHDQLRETRTGPTRPRHE